MLINEKNIILKLCPLCGYDVKLVKHSRIHGHGDIAPEIICENFEGCGLKYSPYYFKGEENLCKMWNDAVKNILC